MKYKNLTIIGTSHIAQESVEEIEHFITTHKPEFVAVELDYKRIGTLMSDEKGSVSFLDIYRIGLKGYLFAVLGGWMQRKLGGVAGVVPGSEMKLAVELAKENKLKLVLIDQDIDITLRKFSKQITWKEKIRFVIDILKALVFRERELRKLGIDFSRFDLTKVPSEELITKLMKQLKKRYPNVYSVLVAQRNVVMASKLVGLMKKFEDKQIVAVVGAGHKEGMMKIIRKKYNLIEVTHSRS